ncbi:MAG: glycosyltransferase family 2 protein [Chloroflexi bacterium]|nr:MAG: glycosyltransferase family 2 protein [Chloroflexota bacterium]RLC85784.1 MAG: glycosyltransferase family 2 protein [Chloroflexota bacterium]
MNPPLVYVIMLTWNQKKDTLTCLDSLSRMTYPNYRIVVVDNGSTDDTVPAVRNQYTEVEVIVNPRNLGFTGGTNVGLRHALSQGTDFVFSINNDTLVSSDILDELISHAAPPDVGVVAPKIYYADESQRIWSVGARQHPLTLEMTDKGRNQIDTGQWEQVLERDYLLGCAQLLKRSVLEEVGLLDETFFLYYDDLDFCLRARKAGYRLLLVPQAKMWHKVAASAGGVDSPRVRYYRARSSVWFLRKHMRGLHWLIVIPYRFGSAVKALLYFAAQQRWDLAQSYLQGLRDGLALSGETGESPTDVFAHLPSLGCDRIRSNADSPLDSIGK